MRVLYPFCLALLALLLASTSPAAPLVYQEPPDLSFSLNTPTFLGSVDAGVNTVTGGTDAFYGLGACPLPSDDPRDTFSFEVPAGVTVTSLEIVTSSWLAPYDSHLFVFYPLPTGGSTAVLIYGAGNTLLWNGASLGAGVYTVHFRQVNSSCNTGTFRFNYQVVITAEGPVPTWATTWGSIKSLYKD